MSVELRESVSKVFTGLQLKEAGTSSNATHTYTHIYIYPMNIYIYGKSCKMEFALVLEIEHKPTDGCNLHLCFFYCLHPVA
jgi:hypothetical protein